MLGTSLPFHWLLTGGAPLGDVPTVLNTLKAHGVESVELRTLPADFMQSIVFFFKAFISFIIK